MSYVTLPNDRESVSLKPPRFQTLRTIVALILREMSSTYGNNPGGYVWAILQPLGTLVVLSFGFALLLRSPALGTNFMMFYATGMLPFQFYGEMAQKSAQSLSYSRALLAYPRMTWIDAVLSRAILAILTQVAVLCIVLTAIIWFYDLHPTIDVVPMLHAISIAALLGIGAGLNNAVLFGLFPVWKTIWGIITRPLLLASAVLYIVEDLPPGARELMTWNPLAHVTGLGREAFYATYNPTYISLPYGYGLGLILVLSGLIFMRANHIAAIEDDN
ncbi:sugar ABC transporter permease [Salipiger sp. IMCC34102]|uniref:ABC transporter permease n=1 Tax=Salipiger sp. IMCC34102 TaxID=2510647 RepID=UPI00101D5AFA|nr:ABC transporter permease [Salipiger sp. IMCC34102]RYH01036.1 sugar ABC transporter permease [Salipiger sp. IMCC34102]